MPKPATVPVPTSVVGLRRQVWLSGVMVEVAVAAITAAVLSPVRFRGSFLYREDLTRAAGVAGPAEVVAGPRDRGLRGLPGGSGRDASVPRKPGPGDVPPRSPGIPLGGPGLPRAALRGEAPDRRDPGDGRGPRGPAPRDLAFASPASARRFALAWAALTVTILAALPAFGLAGLLALHFGLTALFR